MHGTGWALQAELSREQAALQIAECRANPTADAVLTRTPSSPLHHQG